MNTRTGDTYEVPMTPGAQPMKEATAAKVGFRELTENESNLIRRTREVGAQIEQLLKEYDASSVDIDKRWQSIAKTHFQEGLMAAVRGITKPAFF